LKEEEEEKEEEINYNSASLVRFEDKFDDYFD